MAKLTENLTITTGRGETFNFNFAEQYNEVFNLRQEVDNSDAFITLLSPSTTIGQSSIRNAKSIVVRNDGEVGAEIQFKVTDYKNNSNVDDANSIDISGDGAETTRYITALLGAGEYMFLPNARWVSYEADLSAANAKPTTSGDYLSLSSDLEVDSGTLLNDAGVEAADTSITVDNGRLFEIGDLIQLGINDTTATRIEVMRVTAKADHLLTVERALYGTSAADKDAQTDATSGAVDNAKVYFPIFNIYGDYNSFSVVQTDASGRFGAMNFFGYGRVGDNTAGGIVPGSIAGKFYEPGYQAFGLKGITPSTNSGLSASTTYYLSVALNGGTTDKITFTTDANNTNFGGTNGVVQKLQNAIDALYYNPAKNGFQDGATVAIVDGDIRVTSHSRLSTSAVALTTNTDGTAGTDELFDGSNIIGRIPVSAAGAVAARLPDDTMINKEGVTVPNTSVFFYDDGHGNIKGTATGTINYQTGALDFVGLPNAEFAITANYDSAHGGGNTSQIGSQNMIVEIAARSCNSKINTPIEIVAFD
tara:strand:- start:572 stop:2173 length:1602 start_codon:yes stop_codon:yes gene_type:complete